MKILISFLAFVAIATPSLAHDHHDHDFPTAESERVRFLQEVMHSLTESAESDEVARLAEDMDVRLMATVARSLIEIYGDDFANFDDEVRVQRKALAQKLIDVAKGKWSGRPRSLGDLRHATMDFFVGLGHLVKDLPGEIVARAYSGFFEFGALYLAVVVPTYPPWFFASEAAEHFFLGAPIGLACTQLQLGYFLVIGSFLTPSSMLCNYAFSEPQKRNLWERLSATGRNLAMAYKDYFALRALRREYRETRIGGLLRRELRKSHWGASQTGLLKALVKNPYHWSFLADRGHFDFATASDEFSRSVLNLSILKLLLGEMSVLTKELRESKAIGYRTYLRLLKLEAKASKKLRRLFVWERKSAPADARGLMIREIAADLEALFDEQTKYLKEEPENHHHCSHLLAM